MMGIPRDDDVLHGLRESIRKRGRMPTMKELCYDIRIKRPVACRVINRLLKTNKLTADPRGTLPLHIVENEAAKP